MGCDCGECPLVTPAWHPHSHPPACPQSSFLCSVPLRQAGRQRTQGTSCQGSAADQGSSALRGSRAMVQGRSSGGFSSPLPLAASCRNLLQVRWPPQLLPPAGSTPPLTPPLYTRSQDQNCSFFAGQKAASKRVASMSAMSALEPQTLNPFGRCRRLAVLPLPAELEGLPQVWGWGGGFWWLLKQEGTKP